jgi:hypothetical protein
MVRLLVLSGVLLLALYAGRMWPRDQTIHYVLGSLAPRVEELDARWAPGIAADGDWTRTASFRYAPGTAPRVVTHEPRMADGDYTVEIEIVARKQEDPVEAPDAAGTETAVVRKHVILGGGATQIDLGEVFPR